MRTPSISSLPPSCWNHRMMQVRKSVSELCSWCDRDQSHCFSSHCNPSLNICSTNSQLWSLNLCAGLNGHGAPGIPPISEPRGICRPFGLYRALLSISEQILSARKIVAENYGVFVIPLPTRIANFASIDRVPS